MRMRSSVNSKCIRNWDGRCHSNCFFKMLNSSRVGVGGARTLSRSPVEAARQVRNCAQLFARGEAVRSVLRWSTEVSTGWTSDRRKESSC
jgi:hypothetical protein